MKLLIRNASVTLGANEILKNIDFEINDTDKIAIVGRNGCGKTTLLKLIAGLIIPDKSESGEIDYEISKLGNPRIGYLEQISFEDETITLEEEVLKIFKGIFEIKSRLEKLEEEMIQNPTEKVVNAYIATEHDFELKGGYTIDKDYNQALQKFGFSFDDRKKKLSEFSGGQKTRIALIKLLFTKPDVLILDEPTNHLDVDAISWLEEYLKSYQKAIIVVSHDREFLDNVASVVYEIENKTAKRYIGNYTEYVKNKQIQRERQLKEHESYVAEVRRLQTLADKFRYKATKAAMAQSKLKQIDRMEVIDAPENENNKQFHFKLEPNIESGLEVLKLEKLQYGYTNPIGEISCKIYKGDRVAVVGGNGLGKSTLLKTIMQRIPLLNGKIKFGQNIEIGYFDQQTINLIASDKTVLDNFLEEYGDMNVLDARKHLGAFLFTKDDVFKTINSLSGGERVRLELAKLLKNQPNVLILDEPTNHLDIIGRETLEDMLLSFPGTIIFVSHDRYFVKKLATCIIGLRDGICEYYKGTTYEQFLNKVDKQKIVETKEVSNVVFNKPVEKSKNDYKRNKEQTKRIVKLERDIQKLENEISLLNEQYFAPENCSNAELLLKLQTEIQEKEKQRDAYMEEWLMITE